MIKYPKSKDSDGQTFWPIKWITIKEFKKLYPSKPKEREKER